MEENINDYQIFRDILPSFPFKNKHPYAAVGIRTAIISADKRTGRAEDIFPDVSENNRKYNKK